MTKEMIMIIITRTTTTITTTTITKTITTTTIAIAIVKFCEMKPMRITRHTLHLICLFRPSLVVHPFLRSKPEREQNQNIITFNTKQKQN